MIEQHIMTTAQFTLAAIGALTICVGVGVGIYTLATFIEAQWGRLTKFLKSAGY